MTLFPRNVEFLKHNLCIMESFLYTALKFPDVAILL